MTSTRPLIVVLLTLLSTPAIAQMPMRPPPFAGGVPGLAQMQSIILQRHQARTLLYREAIEELKKNPAAADVKECPAGEPVADEVCIRTQKKVASPPQAQETHPAQLIITAKSEPEKKTASSHEEVKMPSTVNLPSVAAKISQPPPVLSRKVAVLFGNNAYPKPIPALETPIADVQAIGRVLQERFGYEVRVVKDAKKADMVGELNKIAAEISPDDSVLVFYAGHGYLMDDTKMGYWIPVDGSTKSPANWISNTDISKFLKNILAKQLIMISDSCFSGSLTREEKMSTSAGKVDRNKIMDKRSVLAMSSGGEEPVSDEGKEGHSIFAWSLINVIKASVASTPGVQIFQVVKGNVVKDYPQEPQYGAVLSAGHMEGGEYLFETSATR
ncbi:MAG: hypothetical protein A2520_03715 [Deltaproteobacteria bacterium RIFOXYD12_FULL_53_23]|nr:MAG: hypothetical protein A2520_03715 [Deltaproteobacteria bacterium RIFOXYD12_FULL_53_23]